MKKLIPLYLIVAIVGLFLFGCESRYEPEASSIDIINDEFPEAKAEIQEALDGIFKSIQDKDADKLISYHIYGPKFTEFRNDGPRFGSEGNEEYERGFVGAISAFDYNLGGLKIDVFGDVAIVTFEADFRPTIENQIHQIWANVTLVFVKVNNTWKITHEHFSQFEKI
jgi:ketosteroid isomerase-like protein